MLSRFFFISFLAFLHACTLETQISTLPCEKIPEEFSKFIATSPNDCVNDEDCELLAVKGTLYTCNGREYMSRFKSGFAASKKYSGYRVFHDRYFSKACDGKRAFVVDRPFTSEVSCENKKCTLLTNEEATCL